MLSHGTNYARTRSRPELGLNEGTGEVQYSVNAAVLALGS